MVQFSLCLQGTKICGDWKDNRAIYLIGTPDNLTTNKLQTLNFPCCPPQSFYDSNFCENMKKVMGKRMCELQFSERFSIFC
jgi:hypothetical protein